MRYLLAVLILLFLASIIESQAFSRKIAKANLAYKLTFVDGYSTFCNKRQPVPSCGPIFSDCDDKVIYVCVETAKVELIKRP